MIRNYFLIAWRQMRKNKLYSSINILGLLVGLSVYVFGTLLVAYERNHDTFWANADRIFTVGSLFSPSANIGVNETDGIYTAFAPFIETDVDDVEAVARTVAREFLVSIDDDHYYQTIRFADPALLAIFDFDYLAGDHEALEDPSGIVLTRDVAKKFFGDTPALGRTLTLDHDHSLHVTAVIENLRPDTHFVSTPLSDGFEVIAPLAALNRISDYDLAGNFSNLSSGDYTYLLVAPGADRDRLQAQMDGVFETHYPTDRRDLVTGLNVRPLIEANTLLWDAVGLPILDSLRVLALLVLVVAIVNYTNLATAQSLGRTREIGLRKTMGATRGQLVAQFLVESVCVAAIAMVLALAVMEVSIPAFNNSLDRGLTLNYLSTLPWLTLTTLLVGIVAGAYPAWLITRTAPIEALRSGARTGPGSSRFRSLMLVVQFTISIFMLAMVMVVWAQNGKVEASGDIYPRAQIITLSRLDVESIRSRLEPLKSELKKIPGVTDVSYSSQLPFEGSNSAFPATRVDGDEDASFLMSQVIVDEHFMDTYGIPLLTGRQLTTGIAGDTRREGVNSLNVVINELGLRKLGFSSPEDALGQVFYDVRGNDESVVHTIVGVMPDQNFRGLQNQILPTVFYMSPRSLRFGSIRVEGAPMGRTLAAIEDTWGRLINDYPIQSQFLEEGFQEEFEIFSNLSLVLTGLAVLALSLSMIGLFGMAAFMAQARTKEIGIRKVMGAGKLQIVRLLIWQLSRPVLWSLLFALPIAWYSANIYLEFFAERITLPEAFISSAGVLSILFAWLIVGVHAWRIARANPIQALRYE